MVVATQVLEALEYLHGLAPPIIYRDMKPSNVIVKSSGRIKMVDFGIARHFQPKSTATMIGTQGYASANSIWARLMPPRTCMLSVRCCIIY
jgi:serine/threonine-protein kinase